MTTGSASLSKLPPEVSTAHHEADGDKRQASSQMMSDGPRLDASATNSIVPVTA